MIHNICSISWDTTSIKLQFPLVLGLCCIGIPLLHVIEWSFLWHHCIITLLLNHRNLFHIFFLLVLRCLKVCLSLGLLRIFPSHLIIFIDLLNDKIRSYWESLFFPLANFQLLKTSHRILLSSFSDFILFLLPLNKIIRLLKEKKTFVGWFFHISNNLGVLFRFLPKNLLLLILILKNFFLVPLQFLDPLAKDRFVEISLFLKFFLLEISHLSVPFDLFESLEFIVLCQMLVKVLLFYRFMKISSFL